MATLRAVFERTIFLTLGVIYGFIVLVKLLMDTVKVGPSAAFSRKKRSLPPTCLEDPALGTHGYAHLENIRMHYVSNGAEDKPLMLLVHGFPEFWYSWRFQLKEFKDNYRVVAVDLRGYGDSDKPSGIPNYAVPVLVNDLKQLVTALGYKQCVLMGHDWGGAISWAFAEMYPDMISRLIICNAPYFRAFQKYMRSNRKQLFMSWYMFLFQMPWLPEFMMRFNDIAAFDRFIGGDMGVRSNSTTPADVEAYKYNFSRNGFTGPINFYRAAFSLAALSVDRTKTATPGKKVLGMPILIVWGDQDAALGTPLAQMSAQYCTGKVSIKIVEGASHWVQMDQPEVVNKHVREFLAEA